MAAGFATTGGVAIKGVAIFALVNVVVESADYGKTIVKLLPI